MPESQSPFSVRAEPGATVLGFGEYVDQPRSIDDDTMLDGLVAAGDLVCDLSHTRYLSSDWLRYLVKLTLRSERLGRRVRLAGVQPNVLETADLIAVKGQLRLFPTVQAALAP